MKKTKLLESSMLEYEKLDFRYVHDAVFFPRIVDRFINNIIIKENGKMSIRKHIEKKELAMISRIKIPSYSFIPNSKFIASIGDFYVQLVDIIIAWINGTGGFPTSKTDPNYDLYTAVLAFPRSKTKFHTYCINACKAYQSNPSSSNGHGIRQDKPVSDTSSPPPRPFVEYSDDLQKLIRKAATAIRTTILSGRRVDGQNGYKKHGPINGMIKNDNLHPDKRIEIEATDDARVAAAVLYRVFTAIKNYHEGIQRPTPLELYVQTNLLLPKDQLNEEYVINQLTYIIHTFKGDVDSSYELYRSRVHVNGN